MACGIPYFIYLRGAIKPKHPEIVGMMIVRLKVFKKSDGAHGENDIVPWSP